MSNSSMIIREPGAPNRWVVSDTHFNHTNIIKYCDRPFTNTHEMEKGLIRNWNSVVEPNDIVFHLGDFMFGGKPEDIFPRLNGTKHLIAGNHDSNKVMKLSLGWRSITRGEHLITTLDGDNVILRHYNFVPGKNEKDDARFQDGSHILLHGHSHGNSHHFVPRQWTLDVGVDCWNWTPVLLEVAIEEAKLHPKNRTLSPKNSTGD